MPAANRHVTTFTTPSDTDVVVTRGCISRATSMTTSTRSPLNWTSVTEPTSTPATRTGAPGLRPATFGKTVLIE